jgi:hypothetical protein
MQILQHYKLVELEADRMITLRWVLVSNGMTVSKLKNYIAGSCPVKPFLLLLSNKYALQSGLPFDMHRFSKHEANH